MQEVITLENFRNELDESVLERGWFYFRKNWVKKPKEVAPGFFEAMVQEVNPHAVSFSLDEEGVFADDFCTCGENLQTLCRHKAAVLFYLEEQQNESEPQNEHITE